MKKIKKNIKKEIKKKKEKIGKRLYLYNTYTVIECNICHKQFNPNSILTSDEGIDEDSLVSFLNQLSAHIQKTHPDQIPTYQVKTIQEWKTKDEIIAALKKRDKALATLASVGIYLPATVGLSRFKVMDSSDDKKKNKLGLRK